MHAPALLDAHRLCIQQGALLLLVPNLARHEVHMLGFACHHQWRGKKDCDKSKGPD